jgi:hypothetical protein
VAACLKDASRQALDWVVVGYCTAAAGTGRDILLTVEGPDCRTTVGIALDIRHMIVVGSRHIDGIAADNRDYLCFW